VGRGATQCLETFTVRGAQSLEGTENDHEQVYETENNLWSIDVINVGKFFK